MRRRALWVAALLCLLALPASARRPNTGGYSAADGTGLSAAAVQALIDAAGHAPAFTMTSVSSADSPVTGAVSTHYLTDINGGSVTINLPAASGWGSNRVIVSVTDVSTGSVVTIDPNSSETINDASVLTLRNTGREVELYSDGSNILVARDVGGTLLGWTPTALAGTVVGLYNFEGDLSDDSGNAYDLSVGAGTARYSTTGGKLGAEFDGSTYFSRAYTADLNQTGAVTIEILMIDSRTSGGGCVVSHNGGGGGSGLYASYQIYPQPQAALVRHYTSAGSVQALSTNGVSTREPFVLTVTRNGSTYDWTTYINGYLQGTSGSLSAPDASTSGAFRVGIAGPSGSAIAADAWVGSIRVINTELTADQVLVDAYEALGRSRSW